MSLDQRFSAGVPEALAKCSMKEGILQDVPVLLHRSAFVCVFILIFHFFHVIHVVKLWFYNRHYQLIRKFSMKTDWCGAEIALLSASWRSERGTLFPQTFPKTSQSILSWMEFRRAKNKEIPGPPPLILDERMEVNIKVQNLITKVST